MIMKVKKIKGIEKNVCFAEQKIAYNYAFKWHEIMKKIYNSNNSQFIKSEEYQKIIDSIINSITYNGIDKKYNIDAIIHCFRNGIEKYITYNTSGILTSYNDIGNIFTCSYPIK